MKEKILAPIRKLNQHMEIAGGWEISRRYAVMNGFDGILTVLGVTISSFLLGVDNPIFVLATGISASIAIGVSGFWIAYLTEEAEQIRNQQHMEDILFTNLDDSLISQSAKVASFVNSIIDGTSPFIFGTISLLAFTFSLFGLLTIKTSYFLSFATSGLLLFVLGIFLGKISNRNIFIMGIKTTFAGIVVLILIILTGI